MANFDKNSQASLSQAQELAEAAKKLRISATNLQSSANASFRFEDGDKLIIKAGLAEIVSLSGDALADAKKNDRPQGYFAFPATVKRGKKEIPCLISARQLYTATVWLEAETLDGVEVTDRDGNPIELFCAPRANAVKRFGEWGAPQTLEGIPFIEKDINVDLTLRKAFVSIYLQSEDDRNAVPAKHTALVAKDAYAIAD